MSDINATASLLKPDRPVGIVGYGAYVPRYRLPAREVSRVWTGGQTALPIKEKAVPGLDEDVITMSIEAARNAMARAGIDATQIRAVWVGSESHPYAVKPTSTLVSEAIGASPHVQAADRECACKAGTEAMVACIGMVGSGMARYALAIGMDTAQGKPGDALEYTASAGGAAYLLGPADESLALLDGSFSFVTDTPDFWRREYQRYPEHGQRFTGEPAYFHHIQSAVRALLEELGLRPGDFRFAVFHQPNPQFPMKVAKKLGFDQDQAQPFVLCHLIGNTYSGAALLGLAHALDRAQPGDRILLASYGSGAGSDAFSFRVTDRVDEIRRQGGVPIAAYLERTKRIDYAVYSRYRGKLKLS